MKHLLKKGLVPFLMLLFFYIPYAQSSAVSEDPYLEYKAERLMKMINFIQYEAKFSPAFSDEDREDIERAKELIAGGVEYESMNEKLAGASFNGDIERVRELIAKGADVNCGMPSVMRTLFLDTMPVRVFKIITGHTSSNELLACMGHTPLMYASWNDHKDIVELLLQYEARANIKVNCNSLAFVNETAYWTALDFAIDNKNDEIANMLESAGAKDFSGDSCLIGTTIHTPSNPRKLWHQLDLPPTL